MSREFSNCLMTSRELYLGDIGIPEAVYRQMGIPYASPFGPRYFVRLNTQ